MASESYLASVLMPHASHQEVVDMMFTAARHAQLGRVPVSPALAASQYKGRLDRVVALASHPGTDPAVLAKFAKDTRVSVRDALICNASTPYETIVFLAPWAVKRAEHHVLDHLISRLDAADAVNAVEVDPQALRESGRYYGQPTYIHHLVEKVVSDADLIRRVLALQLPSFGDLALQALHEGPRPSISLTEAVACIPEETRGRVVATMAPRVSTLTCELAELMVAEYTSTMYCQPPEEGYAMVEPGAADILASRGTAPMFLSAAAMGASEDSLLDGISRLGTQVIDPLIGAMRVRVFSASFERQAIERLSATTVDGHQFDNLAYSCTAILTALRHTLPEQTLLAWLGAYGIRLTQSWLSLTEGPNVPRIGQLHKLLATQPGATVTYRRNWHSGHGYQVEQYAFEGDELMHQLSVSFTEAVTSGTVVPDLTEVLDDFVGRNLPTYAKAVMPALEAAFGSDLPAWETLLTLGADWQSGLQDLIDATASLSGSVRQDRLPQADAGSLEEQVAALAAEQLTLA